MDVGSRDVQYSISKQNEDAEEEKGTRTNSMSQRARVELIQV
jgi:hypothetical protein